MSEIYDNLTPGIYYDKRVIIGKSGTVYYIEPEKISSTRFPEFELMAMADAFSTDINGFTKMMAEVKFDLLKGDLNPSGNIHRAVSKIEQFEQNLYNKANRKIAFTLEFCALFCNEKDEDVESISDAMYIKKATDWGIIPHSDFFFLAQKVKILYYRSYKESMEKAASTEGLSL